MKSRSSVFKIIPFLIVGVFILVGCADETETMTAKPYSFLLSEDLSENESNVPLYYIVDPITESVSVLQSMDDEFEYYDLEGYEARENEISFAYEGRGIEFVEVSEMTYEDSNGHIYRMSTITEE